MKILLLPLIIFILTFSHLALAGEVEKDLADSLAKTQPNEKIPVIIQFNEKPEQAEITSLKSDGATIKHEYKIVKGISAQVPAKSVEKISKKPFVKSIERDRKVRLVLHESVPQIRASDVWAKGITGKGVKVAILDTGIHDEHPALTVEKEVVYNSYIWWWEGTDDLNGHGTKVAGIIASTDSTYRGVAPDADLFNVKVMNKYGYGWFSDVIKGIEWAVDNDADIISMSIVAPHYYSCGSYYDVMTLAINEAVNQGTVVVLSGGNWGPYPGTISLLACADKAITSGSVDDNDNVPDFSSRGPTSDGKVKPDLVAPGVSVMTTSNDNLFKPLSGTSSATPHISGVVALLLDANPTLTPAEIKETLKSTAVDLGLDKNTQGAGRIDAYAAISSLSFARAAIAEFKLDEPTVKGTGSSFTVTLKVKNWGNLNAEGVRATLILPDGLSTDNIAQKVGNGAIAAGAEETLKWIISAGNEGNYEIKADIASENAGSDSATAEVTVKTLVVSVSAPESLAEKEPFNTIATITNIGNTEATEVQAEIIRTGWEITAGKRLESLGSIGVGESKEVAWAGMVIKPGNATITVMVTADNVLPAEDSASITVKPRTSAGNFMEKLGSLIRNLMKKEQ